MIETIKIFIACLTIGFATFAICGGIVYVICRTCWRTVKVLSNKTIRITIETKIENHEE